MFASGPGASSQCFRAFITSPCSIDARTSLTSASGTIFFWRMVTKESIASAAAATEVPPKPSQRMMPSQPLLTMTMEEAQAARFLRLAACGRRPPCSIPCRRRSRSRRAPPPRGAAAGSCAIAPATKPATTRTAPTPSSQSTLFHM